MREQALRMFAKGIGQDVCVEYRPAGEAIDLLDNVHVRVAVAAKLESHRKLMTTIFADLVHAGAPLAVAMKFLPKDAVVLLCDQPELVDS